jgi:class 3 adenylate cyclase/HAMP domain-containing protein
MRPSDSDESQNPNIIARSVAKIAVSVRTKLLFAFLGITSLLVGLSLFGLSALQQANARTEVMLHNQERIAYFNDILGYVQELSTVALALSIDKEFLNGEAQGGWFGTLGSTIISRTQFLQREIAVGVRIFGQPGMPDAENIQDYRGRIAELVPAAAEMYRLRNAGDWDQAAEIGRTTFFDAVRYLQRDAYTTVQGIEAKMRDSARFSAQAFLTSRKNILGAGLVAVGVALLLGYSISSALLWPIGRVRQALGRLAEGVFETRVSVPNRDELGELASHVNDTSAKLGELYEEVETQKRQLADWNAELEDKVQSQVDEIERTNRLRRFLPAQVAEMIVSAPNGADMLRTRRTEITVLFADLRGFTAFSNAATPDQVVAALNTFHGICGPLIEESGGTLERFLGDGLMVLFGAPVPMDNPAQRAVDLAARFRATVPDALSQFQAGSEALGLGVGIGIATGSATLGQIGFEGRLDYSAIGPAPNLASRLCDHAAAGQILISHATAWQVESDMTPAGPFDLKGVGTNIAAFELNLVPGTAPAQDNSH